MSVRFRFSFIAAAFAALCLASTAQAQDKPIRVRGEVIAIDGPMMTVKSRDGKELKMRLADNVSIAAIIPIKIEDIKPNSYIGVSAMPQPDGSQRAMHVHIFPEPMRGVAEEAPEAYKDVSAVVEATHAAGLARKVAKMAPMICVKG